MHRTLYQVFGLPPFNMFDALANDLSDCFTTHPNFRPYHCLSVDSRIFDPEKAKDPKDPDYGKAGKLPSFPLDNPDEMEKVLHQSEKETKSALISPSSRIRPWGQPPLALALQNKSVRCRS